MIDLTFTYKLKELQNDDLKGTMMCRHVKPLSIIPLANLHWHALALSIKLCRKAPSSWYDFAFFAADLSERTSDSDANQICDRY